MAQRIKFKGPATRALDAWYSSGNVADNLRDARRLLESGDPFADIVGRVPRKRREFVYPKLGVVQGAAFERVARQRYLKAIDLAESKNPPVPITTIWETGAGNANFEIDIADRVDHVEVTVRVPGVEVDAADEQQLGLTDVRKQD